MQTRNYVARSDFFGQVSRPQRCSSHYIFTQNSRRGLTAYHHMYLHNPQWPLRCKIHTHDSSTCDEQTPQQSSRLIAACFPAIGGLQACGPLVGQGCHSHPCSFPPPSPPSSLAPPAGACPLRRGGRSPVSFVRSPTSGRWVRAGAKEAADKSARIVKGIFVFKSIFGSGTGEQNRTAARARR